MLNLKDRLACEKAIVKAIVKEAIAQGYQVAVFDGEEDWSEPSNNWETIRKELHTMDEDTIRIIKDGKSKGAVFLVYGNDGYDVVCDHTVNDTIVGIVESESVIKITEKWENKAF